MSKQKDKSELDVKTSSPEALMLAYLCTRDLETVAEKVKILDRFGLSDSDIARVCGCAVKTVWNTRIINAKKNDVKRGNQNGD